MMRYIKNKKFPWQHLITMVIDKICKITVKNEKLKSESFFSISYGVLELLRKTLSGGGGGGSGGIRPPGLDRVKIMSHFKVSMT